MKRNRHLLRMALGGSVCGSFLGIFAGGLLGAIYGCLVGDVSLGLDYALLSGLFGCFAGFIYGGWLALKDDEVFHGPVQAGMAISVVKEPSDSWRRSNPGPAAAKIHNR
ncbi:hypothetical protein BH10PLA2_BH10PLA2_30870 [soil metagenome]